MREAIITALSGLDENFGLVCSGLPDLEPSPALRRQQMQALEDRISRLEQENRMLAASLAKLNAAHERATKP